MADIIFEASQPNGNRRLHRADMLRLNNSNFTLQRVSLDTQEEKPIYRFFLLFFMRL